MRATIISDASWCPDTKVGGYGYWVASELGKAGGGGTFRGEVESSNCAEMLAICNAVDAGMRAALFAPGDILLLQTDCFAALTAFQGDRKPTTHQEIAAVVYLKRIAMRYDLGMSFRHVKGHTNNPEPRYAANRLCDQEAKKGMRAARELIRTEQVRQHGLEGIL
jgi:ribonuclease HI